MELNINIITDAHCKVIIEDNTEYLSETSTGISKGGFKYSDTVSVVVLQHNKTQETVVKSPTYDYHTSDYIEVPVGFDGWFTINYIVLPNKDWFDREREKSSGSALGLYDIVYFVDNGYIYKYVNGEIDGASIEEVLEVNPINTTISRTSKDYVSICFLQKCYVNLCQQIFNDRGFSQCWNKNSVDSELVYKRDLVWMAINVIKYLTEFNQLAEVERIIEQIMSCNGLCTNGQTYKSSNTGCGCNK